MAGPDTATLRRLTSAMTRALPTMVRRLVRLCRATMVLMGFATTVLLVLACTAVPFKLHRWLGSAAGECGPSVATIVVLGGSGMPSGPELLRLHRAAAYYRQYAMSTVLVIHPGDLAVLGAMVDELLLRGVPQDHVSVLPLGDNTRDQALQFARFGNDRTGPVALVTAPENMYRSVRAFRKAGVDAVCGVPAWDHAQHYDFRYRHDAIGGRTLMPDVSGAPGLRYTFWNYLKLEITCMRELLAIAYYRLNGWI
jgi:uncharacterized SAM-binding protein YcdF (DUF218 family)